MLNLAVGQTRTYKKLTCRTSNWLHEILLGNDSHSFSCRVKFTKNKFWDLSWELPADLISKSVAPQPRQKVCKHSNCFNCQSLQKELKIYIKKIYFHKKRVFCVDLLPFQYNPTTQPEDACFRVISPKNVLCLFYSCEDQTPAFCSHAHDAYLLEVFSDHLRHLLRPCRCEGRTLYWSSCWWICEIRVFFYHFSVKIN